MSANSLSHVMNEIMMLGPILRNNQLVATIFSNITCLDGQKKLCQASSRSLEKIILAAEIAVERKKKHLNVSIRHGEYWGLCGKFP